MTYKILSNNCNNCPVLLQTKFTKCIAEDKYPNVDVLFLTPSYRVTFNNVNILTKAEHFLLSEAADPYSLDWTAIPAFKCPDIKDADIDNQAYKSCRPHVEDTVKKVNPKVVIPLGNVALKVLTGLSGIDKKRGKVFDWEGYNVVPTFNLQSVIKEPVNKKLFLMDVKNAIEKYANKVKTYDYQDYVYANRWELFRPFVDKLKNTLYPVAIDLETTGLNFLTDKIQTVSISSRYGTVVIPVDHKEANLDEKEKTYLLQGLREILRNPANNKPFHNAKFDLKFLMRYGLTVKNACDTEVMASLIDENRKNGLMDLVKEYFPNEIKDL